MNLCKSGCRIIWCDSHLIHCLMRHISMESMKPGVNFYKGESPLLYFFASPSGKMILNTKKKITMDTPPVINATRTL